MKTCSIDGCKNKLRARGWCANHYYRWQRHGDPCGGKIPPGSGLEFIANNALWHDADSCLLWPYGLKDNGYATVFIGGRPKLVHRVICEAVNGFAPAGHHAAHSCGTRHCVNPAHLRWATPAENEADKIDHDRIRAKLTRGDVIAIRRAAQSGALQRELAAKFGVKQPQISRILRRASWIRISEQYEPIVAEEAGEKKEAA